MTASLTLVAFAILAATLGPRQLTRSTWPNRSPLLGILLWQALTVSVLAAMVLAGLALAVPEIPFTTDIAGLIAACATALRAQYSTPGGAAISAAGAVLTLTVLSRVGYCTAVGLLRASRARRRQAQALSVAASRHVHSEALVVDHASAAAYCLPGRQQQVVLTTGALAALDAEQVAAVLSHERAHLRGRHHLVLAMAAALHKAFPRVAIFLLAHQEQVRLVEMLADDAATREHERLTVATALVRLAEASAPAAALGAGGSTAIARVRRLVAPAQPLGAARTGAALAATLALILVPLALLAAPGAAAVVIEACPIDFAAGPS